MLKQIAICIALIGTPQFAAAQTIQDQIVEQLQAQGFTNIQVSRTWLGRVRILSRRGDLVRELVFNPQTGEILRDFWRNLDDDRSPWLFVPDMYWFDEEDDHSEDDDPNDDEEDDYDDDDKDDDDKDDEPDDD